MTKMLADYPAAARQDAAEGEPVACWAKNDIEARSLGRSIDDGTERVAIFGMDDHIRTLRDIEADVILLAVEAYGGQVSEIARHLRLGRNTLYRRLDWLGVLRTS